MVALGPRGAALIKSYETLRLKAYKPTPNDVWTVGYGSTRGVVEGMVINEMQANERFIQDTKTAVEAVGKLQDKMRSVGNNLTPSMIDALISIVFNGGPAVISSSNTIGRSLLSSRADKYYLAWRGFALWTKQRNKTVTTEDDDLLGLARRRSQEMMLFLEDGIPR